MGLAAVPPNPLGQADAVEDRYSANFLKCRPERNEAKAEQSKDPYDLLATYCPPPLRSTSKFFLATASSGRSDPDPSHTFNSWE
jgi:hypothetical protein